MVHPGEYAHWYYLVYLLPGGVALLLLLLSALGGGTHHAHHVAPHAGLHVAPHATPHAGAGHGLGHGSGHEQGHHEAAGRASFLGAFFGIGRVPLPLVWGSWLLGWGLFGFWGTQFWEQHGHAAFLMPAFLTALAGAALTGKATVAAAARLMPREASSAVGTVGLCGLTGTVAFATDDARGRVHVYDAFGTLHDVSARAAPGSDRIARGRRALVTDYDAARDQVIVEEAP